MLLEILRSFTGRIASERRFNRGQETQKLTLGESVMDRIAVPKFAMAFIGNTVGRYDISGDTLVYSVAYNSLWDNNLSLW
jgi:hypothetical protein